MKNLSDAALLRNRMVAVLEEATLETDESARRKALPFVTAGGGFAGVETTRAVNDFVRETAQYYPSIPGASIRVVVVHPGSFLLPELGEDALVLPWSLGLSFLAFLRGGFGEPFTWRSFPG